MLNVLFFGANREDAQNRIGLGELHHDVVLFFEKMVELEAIDIEMVEADDEFAFVVVIRAMGQEMLAAFIDEARDLVDLLAGISGEFVGSFHRFGPFFGGHITAGSVDRGDQ
jgi:hypothetical protein